MGESEEGVLSEASFVRWESEIEKDSKTWIQVGSRRQSIVTRDASVCIDTDARHANTNFRFQSYFTSNSTLFVGFSFLSQMVHNHCETGKRHAN